MKVKLIVIVVFVLFVIGVVQVYGQDGGLCSFGVVISNVIEISNDIYVQGYGLVFGFMLFSLELFVVVDFMQFSNNNLVDLGCGSSNKVMVDG